MYVKLLNTCETPSYQKTVNRGMRKSQTWANNLIDADELKEIELIEANTLNFLSTLGDINNNTESTNMYQEEPTNKPMVTRNRSQAISLPVPAAQPNSFSTIGNRRASSKPIPPKKPSFLAGSSRLNASARPTSKPIQSELDKLSNVPIETPCNTHQNSPQKTPELSKRSRTATIIEGNSLFNSRRISLQLKEKKIKPNQSNDFANSFTDSSLLLNQSSFEIDESMEKDKLKQKFDKTLKEKWDRELFRRYLQQIHFDQILDFYLAIERFPGYMSKLQCDNGKYVESVELKKKFCQKANQICIRFQYYLPKCVSAIIFRIILPLLSQILGIPAQEPPVDSDTSDEEQHLIHKNESEYFIFNVDDEDYELNSLSPEAMEHLQCEDKDLFKSE